MKYELPSTELIVIEENNYLKFGEYLNDMQCDDATNKLCLDDLEYVNKLQQENEQLKAQIKEYQKALDETISKKIDVENNWNKLKEYIKETKLKEFEKSYGKRYGKTFIKAEIIVCNMILDKMQEIEGSDINDSN